MRKKLIFFLLIPFIFLVSNKIVKGQRNYDSLLSSLVQVIKNQENITDELLFQCIPISTNEYLIFSNLDYGKCQEDSYIFRKINELWVNKCIKKNINILHGYFEYSQFVDGYFADDYFDNIERIFNSGKKNWFCKELHNCSQKKIRRLLKYIENNKLCE